MTDEKEAPDDLGEVDWESALSDWESKTFVPEVAKDVVTEKPAALSGHNVSRPLYRPPPQVTPRPKAQAASVAPIPSFITQNDEDGEEGATVIAVIPPELLRRKDQPPPRPSSSISSRGGLGQFFAREDRRDSGSQDEGTARSAAPPKVVLQDEAVTSSRAIPTPQAERSGVAPVRRHPDDERESGGVAEMLDAFVEPRAEQLTIPAESEVDRLLDAPAIERGREVDEEEEEAPTGQSRSLLSPEERKYDPDDETIIGRSADLAAARTSGPATRSARSLTAGANGGAAPSANARTWTSEKPASDWLDDAARAALRSRAAWLEDEARALVDDVARGRGLVVCSELLATLGHRDRAEMLAAEARDLAPSLALAHRQARALLPSLPGPRAHLEALDAEVKVTPAGSARAHSMLLAAAAATEAGDEDDADRRLDQAARMAPGDLRAAVDRVARALGRSEPGIASALRLPQAAELAPVAEALRTCLRFRGVGATAGTPLPTEILMRAREALDRGDLAVAAPLIVDLSGVPGLSEGATWLAAAIGAASSERRAASTKWLQELVDEGEDQARRPLAARALELSNGELLAQIAAQPGPFDAAERVILDTLSNRPFAADSHLDTIAADGEMQSLASAVAALSQRSEARDDRTAPATGRAKRVAGSPQSRALVEIGRMLASSAATEEIASALQRLLEPAGAVASRALALELATRAGRVSDVCATLEAWGAKRGSAEETAIGAMAAAIIAERSGDRAGALQSYKVARAADGTSEAALRAVASLEPVDMIAEMNALADELGDGIRAAVARIEAVTLGEGALPDPTQAHLLESAHRAAPTLPIAAFLAERIARRAGDVEEVLRWLRDRRANAVDPMEGALDAVREALLVADREPQLAGERLREAHHARPDDVALRELYERMAGEPPDDRAAWRERRAQNASGDARTLLLLDAAHELERAGDDDGALRCAEAAANADSPIGRVARERAELRTGRVARLADELFAEAKGVEDPRARREAFERLADLDLTVRHDPAGALLWHRSIFEVEPDYKPSLRYLEQHLVSEGRVEELEPVASAIASVLRGTQSPECTAHAELAARLRMRGAVGSWEATRELVELAAGEREPSIWSLRMLQSHSRARGDDAAFLAVTKRLVERASRSLETATLLVRAGEAAARLGNAEEAATLFERATVEDPGDIVAWELLVDLRRLAGDARGAAEASESVARASLVRERQLAAWYDAGCLWQDHVKDDDRALAALEAAAAIDVAHADLFDRLSHIYASRKRQPELADLLQRRMDCVTDPGERLIIEVRRGRVLFEAGDPAGARQAFQSALAEHPDDAAALAAFTDLCLAQGDWEEAEQALIRLARLLPTPDEQRTVYANLGELYSHHLLNLPRAEVALKEVLKCAPDDPETTMKLVDVYKRQNDATRAIELQQNLIQKSRSPEQKRARIIELSAIQEQVARDNRKAEQTLEGARRESPQDVALLRALAEFYTRHRQTPAVNILLDRAGADARRALTAGRLVPASFEILATVFELRGRTDAARVSLAMLATLEGRPVDLRGAGVERAFDPQLDELLAPEAISQPMRGLLAKTGDALDAVAPVDLRTLRACPIGPDTSIARLVAGAAAAIDLGSVTVLVSPRLGAVCIPVGSTPPTILVGETLATDERIASFLVLRALKLVRVKASALARTVPGELGVLVSAWLKCFNETWEPQGINPASLSVPMARIQAALPRSLDPDLGVVALEVAGAIGTRQATLGPAALAWANRAAFLALGDPNAALDAIASAGAPGVVGVAGPPRAAPRDAKERAAWVARTPEARDLVAFGVADAFAEARSRLGLDR
jgi:tetratricopeptide (TPR) repeat protein